MREGRRFISLLVICLYISRPAIGQDTKTVSIKTSAQKFEQVVQQIEVATPYRFYYHAADLDSFLVTVTAETVPVTDLLKKIFLNTGFYFVVDASDKIYIAKQPLAQAILPDDFFDRTKKLMDTNTSLLPQPDNGILQTKIKSSVENRLFEIGAASALHKDKVALAGYIKEAKTGEPMAGVSVYVDSLSAGVITDQFGYYTLTLPAGRHTIKINSVGMKSTSRQVLLHADGKLNIELMEYIPSLKEVVVTSTRTSNIRGLRMGADRLTIQTIRQVPVVFGEADVLRVIMQLPGVTSVGEASTGFNVRGGAADQNLILLNGATVYNPSHLFGFFSAFNPDIIKGVELYKSAIPEKYGGRLASVLDVTTKEGNSKKITGTAGIGPLTSKVAVEGPVAKGKTTFIASARTTYSDWLLHQVPNSAYKNSTASFYDADLHLTHTINAKNSLYLNAYLSHDRFRLNSDTAYQYGNRNINGKWKHNFTNQFYGIATAGIDNYRYAVSSENNPVNAYRLSFSIQQAYLRTDFSYAPSQKHLFTFGAASVYYKLHPGSFVPVGQQSLVVPDKLSAEQALESALYAGDEYTLTPKLSLHAGLRYSVFNYLGPHEQYTYQPGVPRDKNSMQDTLQYGSGKVIKTYSNPEYRLTLRYTLSDNSSVKASYNSMVQYIHTLSNTNAISPTDVWKLSDGYIKPQTGNQVSLGFYQNFMSNTVETSVEVYYKQLKNYLDYKSGAVLTLNHHIETDILDTKGKAYGAEFLLKKSSGKLNGWVSYTYSRTFLQSADPLGGEKVNDGKYYPANYDKPHNANFSGNYKFSHRYSLSLGVNYSTGRPITLPLAVFNLGGAQRVYYSERNGFRIPDYFRTDVSFMIEGNHRTTKATHNFWTVGAYNVTARKNVYSVYFIEENGIVKGYRLSIFGTIIPFVTYNIRF